MGYFPNGLFFVAINTFPQVNMDIEKINMTRKGMRFQHEKVLAMVRKPTNIEDDGFHECEVGRDHRRP